MLNKKDLREKSINLNQFQVIDNIDKMIELKLKEISLYKELKASLFLHKLTNEKIVYEVIFNGERLYFNEVDGKKLLDGRGYEVKKIDIVKLRMKNLVE